MEKIFLEILATQKDILAELKLIRETLSARESVGAQTHAAAHPAPAPVETPVAAPAPLAPPAPSTPEVIEATREPQPAAFAPQQAPGDDADAEAPFRRLEEAFGPFAQGLDVKRSRHAPKLTLRELQDIGGSFLESQGKKPKPESENSRENILDEIKDRNRKKRDAFSEIERLTRNR